MTAQTTDDVIVADSREATALLDAIEAGADVVTRRRAAAALVAQVAQHPGATHADGLIADVRALADQLAPKLERLAEYLAGLEVDVPTRDGGAEPLPDELRPTVDDLFAAMAAVVLQRPGVDG